jgi:hypothetical protein
VCRCVYMMDSTRTEAVASEWAELEATLTNKHYSSIALPLLDPKQFTFADFSLESAVDRFVRPEESSLSKAICAVESAARAMASVGDIKSPYSDVAKHFLNCFSAVSQLPGWQHVQNYIENPQLYIDRTRSAQKGDEVAAAALNRSVVTTAEGGPIDQLQHKGQKLIRRLCQRIDWFDDLRCKAGKPFDAELCVKTIAADRGWAEDANAFMKDAETKVTTMLTQNPQKFHGKIIGAVILSHTLCFFNVMDSVSRVATQRRSMAAQFGVAKRN